MPHLDRQTIVDRLQAVTVRQGQRYQHYKTRGIYVVEKLVMLEATDRIAVAYHDENFPELTWIRDYQDFTSQIDGRPRFSLLS